MDSARRDVFRLSLAVVALLAWLGAGRANAKVFADAGVAAPFLKIGQGARASAMGEAFTAVADDSTAVFWNPAGLAQLHRIEAQFTHNQWIQGFRQEYLGLAVPFAGTWAVAYSLIDLGEFAGVDAANVPTGDTLTINGQVLMLGYARGFVEDSVLVGVAAKMVKEDLDDGITGRTATVDLGVLYLPWWDDPRVSIAGVLENIGGELTGFTLPLAFRMGAAWRVNGVFLRGLGFRSKPSEATFRRGGSAEDRMPGRRKFGGSLEEVSRAYSRYPWEVKGVLEDSLTLAMDVRFPQQGRAELHVGTEYWLSIVALRAGYRYRFPRNELGGLSGLTLGFGFRGRGFRFDYGFDFSYAPMGELGNASRFSVSVNF